MILIQLLLITSLVALLLFFISPRFRAWVLLKLMERAQKKMQEKMNGQRQERHNYQREQRNSDPEIHPHEKVALDDIEAKRFKKRGNDEYVDFEELP